MGLCACNANAMASTAKSMEGQIGWGNPGFRGGIGWFTENKCNKFVNNVASESGNTPPLVNGRPATAYEIGDITQQIDAWTVVNGGAQPGDLISNGNHVNIVTGSEVSTGASSVTGTVRSTAFGFKNGKIQAGFTLRRCSCSK